MDLRAGIMLLVVGLSLPLLSEAQGGAASLPIPEVGAMPEIAGARELPEAGRQYRIVFDVKSASEKEDVRHQGLVMVATLVNTFAQYGVDADHRQFAVLLHGPTTEFVLTPEAYAKRHPGQTNPNLTLLEELTKAGVRLMVCGQSARAHHIETHEIQKIVQVNLSATVTLMNLESQEGYVRIEE